MVLMAMQALSLPAAILAKALAHGWVDVHISTAGRSDRWCSNDGRSRRCATRTRVTAPCKMMMMIGLLFTWSALYCYTALKSSSLNVQDMVERGGSAGVGEREMGRTPQSGSVVQRASH